MERAANACCCGVEHLPRCLEDDADAAMARVYVPLSRTEEVQGAAHGVDDLAQGTAAHPGRGQSDA